MYLNHPNLSTKNPPLAKFLTLNEYCSNIYNFFKTIFLTNKLSKNILYEFFKTR